MLLFLKEVVEDPRIVYGSMDTPGSPMPYLAFEGTCCVRFVSQWALRKGYKTVSLEDLLFFLAGD